MIAHLEELEKLDASEIYPRRINAKEVLTPQRSDTIYLPVADRTAKLSGRDYRFREPTLRQEQLVRSEDLRGELQGEVEEFQPTQKQMVTLKPEETSGRYTVTSFIVIASFHFNTFMYHGGQNDYQPAFFISSPNSGPKQPGSCKRHPNSRK